MMFRILGIILLLLLSRQSFASITDTLSLSYGTIGAEGILLNIWKFHSGDNMEWTKPDFDDSDWQSIDPTEDMNKHPEKWKNGVCWMRLNVKLSDVRFDKKLALLVEQIGACELYINGRLVKKYGEFSSKNHRARGVFVQWDDLIPIEFDSNKTNVLAVRFELEKIPYVNFANWKNRPMVLRVVDTEAVPVLVKYDANIKHYIQSAVFFMMTLLHLVLFLMGSNRKSNFNFFLFSLVATINFSTTVVMMEYVDQTATRMYLTILIFLLCTGSYFLFMRSVYVTLQQPVDIFFKSITGVFLVSLPAFLFYYDYGWIGGLLVLPTLVFLDAIRITFVNAKIERYRIRIIRYGAVGFITLYLLSLSFYFGLTPIGVSALLGDIAFALAFASVPIAMSIQLAMESSLASRTMLSTANEVLRLSDQAREHEKELNKLREICDRNSRIEQLMAESTLVADSFASADEQFLKRVLAAIEENIGNPNFDVTMLCRSVGISRAQLNRRLNGVVRQSPAQLIRTLRLERAAALLRNQVDNVGNIAFMVGYTNPAHFSKAFKDMYGLTPMQFTSERPTLSPVAP